MTREVKIPGHLDRFQESVIREMTRVAEKTGAINLSQGIPDFPAPAVLKKAARRAVRQNHNQYSPTYGLGALRSALARKLADKNQIYADPEEEITVTCGVSEGIVAACLALLARGDEVLVFEPFYENYLPALYLAGARPVFIPLRHPDFTLDFDRLGQMVTGKVKALILNNPMNPSGRVFSREELLSLSAFCRHHGLLVITDEIYEDIIFDRRIHHSIAALPEMYPRTVTVMGFSKSYGVTGWRVGYVTAPPPLSRALRKVHDYLTICAPTPFQQAARTALSLSRKYYEALVLRYQRNRDLICSGLRECGFQLKPPQGAYYVLADFSPLNTGHDDIVFARLLAEERGVATVPGSSFFADPESGRNLVRFSFAVRENTLREALRRIKKRVLQTS